MADGVASTTDVMGPPSTGEERNIMSPRIIVQGGAYSLMLADLTEVYKKTTKESAKKGYAILTEGGTAVKAVEEAVRVFENKECFNSGCGSYLNCKREVECDAMIMEGHTLNNGAVICGRHFRNPVSLSKLIMEQSPHCALSGDGALEFAMEKDFPICDPEDLKSPYAIVINHTDFKEYVRHHYMGNPVNVRPDDRETNHTVSAVAMDGQNAQGNPVEAFPDVPETNDTVSAVAMDAMGHLACATSTGGIAGKLKGRVGDAPLVGCGGYANKMGGATTTGVGESIIKLTLAREVVYNMENGQNAQESARNALDKMEEIDDGYGGVIAIDKNGNFGKAFNTTKMVWASIKDNTLEFGMEQNEVDTEQL